MSDPGALAGTGEGFVKECLLANERGDGVLYATMHRGRYLYNTTPKDGQWLEWTGIVWRPDDFRASFGAVEFVALEYERQLLQLMAEINEQGIDKNHDDAWKLDLVKEYRARIKRLRTEAGARKTLVWAPVVDTRMACREQDLDRQPWLLPCRNGVIDLQTGALLDGRPDDLMTRAIDVDYDPTADSTEWERFVEEIAGGPEVATFLRRLFGYACTGHSYEQYIAVFIGSGRNGKGVLFSCLAAVLGPYYHVISPGMLTESKVEPSPNAASEHKYALMGKRLVVAGESKRGQRIDAGQIKGLTGDDAIECRPLFSKTVIFNPTHTLMLHTNHMPTGIGSEFSLLQRLLKIDFPWSYVDDPEAEARRYPTMGDCFRQKDKHLKERLLAHREGILRWLVVGCLEWQRDGLNPPASIMESVDELARQEDYLGEYLDDCVDHGHPDSKISLPELYRVFLWWWSNNRGDVRKDRVPTNRTVAKMLRDRGWDVQKKGGKMWIYGAEFKYEITQEILSDARG